MRATCLVMLLHLLLAGCEVSYTTGDEDVLTDPGPEAEREEALAQRFLVLLDSGAVDETYPVASTAIKEEQGRATWELTLGGLRRLAGEYEMRELAGYGYTNELSDGPPGSYFVIDYRTTSAGSWVSSRVA